MRAVLSNKLNGTAPAVLQQRANWPLSVQQLALVFPRPPAYNTGMDAQQQLDQALASPTPRSALQRVMAAWLETGLERPEITTRLSEAIQRARASGARADLLEELLDGFDGWCRV